MIFIGSIEFLFLFTAIIHVQSRDTTCLESQKLYADLCFSPTPSDKVDHNWIKSNQPSEGWYTELGNDVVLLHTAELVIGKHLTKVDIDDTIQNDICIRTKITDSENGNQVGEWFALGGLYYNFTCKPSQDYVGVKKCDLMSDLGDYHEDISYHISYSDNKNFYVSTMCYATGQVGWHTSAVRKNLTEEEKKQVYDHVKSLGFPETTTVALYNDNCF